VTNIRVRADAPTATWSAERSRSAHRLAQAAETQAARLLKGEALVIFDERSNRSGLVLLADRVTPTAVAFCVRHTSGYIGVTLETSRADELGLPLIGDPGSPLGYAVSVDAAQGVTTGISARDRAVTVRTLAASGSGSADLCRPGHVVPIRVPEGRGRGHPLALAGHRLAMAVAGVARVMVAELTGISDPLGPATADDSVWFAAQYDLELCVVPDRSREFFDSWPSLAG
jgi:3,4-dihydroxy 2-butanone 4-phosphate synthase/GTP cyclohydrolase II